MEVDFFKSFLKDTTKSEFNFRMVRTRVRKRDKISWGINCSFDENYFQKSNPNQNLFNHRWSIVDHL